MVWLATVLTYTQPTPESLVHVSHNERERERESLSDGVSDKSERAGMCKGTDLCKLLDTPE